MTSRSYVFTLNNWSEEDLDKFPLLNARYIIYGEEIAPTTKTPHLQGYMEFKNAVRMTHIKKTFPTMHLEPRKGTREQARDYCTKESKYTEIGDWSGGGQGNRCDLKKVIEMVKANVPERDIMEECPGTVAKTMRFFDKCIQMREKEFSKPFRNVDVIVLWGDAGCGKTRLAREMYPNIFTVNCGENFPFDGYEGESEILLDDFYGGLQYHVLLRVLDGHQYRVEIKGGHRYARWNTIVITSNKPPELWYSQGCTPALKRRLTYVEHMCHGVPCHEVPGNTEPALDDGLLDEIF